MTKQMTDLEFLHAVKAKIATRETWTREANARDSAGLVVHPSDTNAVCWCLSGAALALAGNGGGHERLTRLVERVRDGQSVVTINDNLGFDSVHQLLDAALRQQAEGGRG